VGFTRAFERPPMNMDGTGVHHDFPTIRKIDVASRTSRVTASDRKSIQGRFPTQPDTGGITPGVAISIRELAGMHL
jgi:hypothetical protein